LRTPRRRKPKLLYTPGELNRLIDSLCHPLAKMTTASSSREPKPHHQEVHQAQPAQAHRPSRKGVEDQILGCKKDEREVKPSVRDLAVAEHVISHLFLQAALLKRHDGRRAVVAEHVISHLFLQEQPPTPAMPLATATVLFARSSPPTV